MRYRGYTITYDPPPIPVRSMDYHYAHDDFDGGPWETGGPPMDERYGSAGSVEECIEAIDELEAQEAA